jgi:hypothetical protein
MRGRTKLVMRRAACVEVAPVKMMHRRRVRHVELDVDHATLAVAIAEGDRWRDTTMRRS